MDKDNVSHTHTQSGILFSHKKEILPFVTTWVELEGIMLTENKSDRERQILYVLPYMRNLETPTQRKRD